MVGVFGGSLGARRINEAVAGLVDDWREPAPTGPSTTWSDGGTGRTGDAWTSAPARAAGPGRCVRVPYEERMELLYAAVDVMVCRAGAMTVAELAVAGCPAVLVPLPGAPGDHQTANARVLERAGGARILSRRRLRRPAAGRRARRAARRRAALEAMGRAGRRSVGADAAAAGARVVEAHARPARTRSPDGEAGRGR